MPALCVSVGEDFNLDLTMYPSFLSSIYDFEKPGYWVRRIGFKHLLVQQGGELCCSGDGCSHRLLHGIGGLWCWSDCISILRDSGFNWLLELYPGLRIAAALEPVDRILVSSAVVLSANTSYAGNVRRWMKLIFGGLDLKESSLLVEAASTAEKLTSPQPRLLARILPELRDVVLKVGEVSLETLRKRLLSIKGVGPKIADAIILFTGASSMVAPGDRHLTRFARYYLGLTGKLASKNMCLKGGAWCRTCSISRQCLQGLIVASFSAGAGLVQTISYVHGRLGTTSWREKLYRELEAFYR
ncbi:MAG: hypothetical protein OWQ48_01945 [Desulfurococcus sp.]|nr:hypothetical protein [Desulfurococcus sp.]